MNLTTLLPQSGTNYKLYYLVPLSFIYLFSQLEIQIYLLFSIVALIGAASRHSHGEAIYGPDGEEKAELTDEEEIRRIGTTIFRDKEPSAYSATTSEQMIKEGNLHSKSWGVIVVVLSLFQGALSFMYAFALYELYIYRFEIGFIGAVLLFSLSTLLVYKAMKALWPNASSMDQVPKIDSQLKEIVWGFMFTLKPDGVSISGVEYEPAEGGILEIDCEVDYEYSGTIREDVNRVAITFCSIVDRSSYPIEQAEICLTTADDVVVEFEINPMWSRQLLDGELSSKEYISRVYQTISVNSSENKTLESHFRQ